MLGVGVGAASAAPSYSLIPPLFPEPSLPLAIGLTVDNSGGPSAGDVFATGYEGNLVEKFDKEGNNVNFTELSGNEITGLSGPVGLAVSPSGDLFVANEAGGTIQVFDDTTGQPVAFPAGSFIHGSSYAPFGIAFDTSTSAGDPSKGDVYITDHANKVVNKFKPNGEFISSFGAAELASPQPDNIAVDAEGNVYVNNRFGGTFKFSPTGTSLGKVTSNATQAVAIDPSTGHVFIKEGGESEAFVQEYSSTGTKLAQFGSGVLVSSYAMAVNSVTHGVYLSDINSGKIDRFEQGETPEVPVTEAATEVAGTTAKLHGTVNPGGSGEAGYHFSYNANGLCDGAGSLTTEPVAPAPRNNEAVVSEATGLAPKTTYKFCLVASNPFGSAPGNELEFTTEAGRPVVEAQVVEALTETSATIGATINPSGAPTTCKVEYGLTIGYGSEAPCPATPGLEGEGTVGVPVSVTLPGLAPGTEYHYAFVASNAKGVAVREEDATFVTNPLVLKASIEKELSEKVGRHSASLGATINPKGSETTYFFEYGKTTSYEKGRTPGGTLAAGIQEGVAVTPEAVLELDSNTLYHYRVVTSNPAGIEVGHDETFMTAPPQLPVVEAQASSQVTQTTAVLTATINPNGLPTSYTLEVGTEVEGHILYTPTFGEVGSGTGGVGLTFALSGLQPGTVYHFRVLAVGTDGTVPGADQVFITPGFGSLIIPPAPPQIIPTPVEVIKPGPPGPGRETRAQKYKAALKLCAKKPKKQRAACDRRAKKQFGPVTRKHKKK